MNEGCDNPLVISESIYGECPKHGIWNKQGNRDDRPRLPVKKCPECEKE